MGRPGGARPSGGVGAPPPAPRVLVPQLRSRRRPPTPSWSWGGAAVGVAAAPARGGRGLPVGRAGAWSGARSPSFGRLRGVISGLLPPASIRGRGTAAQGGGAPGGARSQGLSRGPALPPPSNTRSSLRSAPRPGPPLCPRAEGKAHLRAPPPPSPRRGPAWPWPVPCHLPGEPFLPPEGGGGPGTEDRARGRAGQGWRRVGRELQECPHGCCKSEVIWSPLYLRKIPALSAPPRLSLSHGRSDAL